MPVTFDGDNLIIILPAVVAGVLDVDVEQDLYSDWKEWLKTSDNAKYPLAFRTVGGDALTTGIDAGAYFFIRNDLGWRIRPAENDGTYNVAGNLVPQDSTLPILIPTIGAYRVLVAGLQPVTQNIDTIKETLESGLFNKGIVINNTRGVDTSDGLVGTEKDPVKNDVRAAEVHDIRGISQYYLEGTNVLTADHSNGNVFVGAEALLSVSILSGADVTNCTFINQVVTGTASGNMLFSEAILQNLSGMTGIIKECGVGGTLTLGNVGNSGKTQLSDSSALHPGVTIDAAAAGSIINGDGLRGKFTITNKTGAEHFELNFQSGSITFDASCTGGTANITGNCVITNNGTVTVTNSTIINSVMAEDYPVDGQSAMTPTQALYAITQLLTEFKRTGTTISVKKRDGVTEAFPITIDSDTAPTSATQSG